MNADQTGSGFTFINFMDLLRTLNRAILPEISAEFSLESGVGQFLVLLHSIQVTQQLKKKHK